MVCGTTDFGAVELPVGAAGPETRIGVHGRAARFKGPAGNVAPRALKVAVQPLSS